MSRTQASYANHIILNTSLPALFAKGIAGKGGRQAGEACWGGRQAPNTRDLHGWVSVVVINSPAPGYLKHL